MSQPSQKFQNTNELYSKLPLGNGQIRVLDFGETKDIWTEDAPLEATIRVVSLSDDPQFYALSYCWGPSSDSTWIPKIQLKVDNTYESEVMIEITVTAFAAIKDTLKHLGPVTIWIDSISIDQENMAEKEIQIPLMTEIYSSAVRVCIHLGAGTRETNAAMAWMEKASRRRYNGVGLLGRGAAPEKSWFTLIPKDCFIVFIHYLYLITLITTPLIIVCRFFCMQLSFRPSPFILKAEIYSIDALLSRPWIQRAWTWQELVLAKGAIVICGAKVLPWERFILALSVLDLCCHGPELEFNGAIPIFTDSAIGTLYDTSRSYRKTKRHFPPDSDIKHLKEWCFLAECWLRFGRPVNRKPKVGRASLKRTYLDYHLRHYRLGSRLFVWYLVIGLILPVYTLVKGIMIYPKLHNPLRLWYSAIGALMTLIVTWYVIRVLETLRQNMERYSKLPMAFATVPTLRGRNATNPKDLCYGFYGVLMAEGVTQLQTPDYGRDERQVFKDFLLDLLRWDGRALTLLLDCCKFEQPSWSPDWRFKSKQSWLNNEYFYGLSNIGATTNSTPHYDITDNRNGLFVYGGPVNNSRIVWISTGMKTSRDRGEMSETQVEIWNLRILIDWLRNGLQDSLDSETIDISLRMQIRIFEALEVELVSDSTSSEEKLLSKGFNAINDIKSLARLSNGFTSWLKVLKPFLRINGPMEEEEDDWEQDIVDEWIPDSGADQMLQCYRKLVNSEKAFRYHRRICNEIINNRLLFIFSSSDGVHFGTGSMATEVNDSIYLISGLPVPMLLRNIGSKRYVLNNTEGEEEAFVVVGPAFISKMMRGEVWFADTKDGPRAKKNLHRFYLV